MIRHLNESRSKSREHGFTLIELLIVIVILGILATVVVLAVSGISSRGKAEACKSDMKSVEVASEAYYAKNGSYAANIAALVTAGFLRQAPSSTNYTISYTSATGAVTGDLTGGTTTTDCSD